MKNRNLVRLGVLCLLIVGTLSGVSRAQAAKNGSVTGNVLDPAGDSIPGAAVELDAPDTAPHATHTAADGSFSFAGLPSGTYLIRVWAEGFSSLEQSSVGYEHR